MRVLREKREHRRGVLAFFLVLYSIVPSFSLHRNWSHHRHVIWMFSLPSLPQRLCKLYNCILAACLFLYFFLFSGNLALCDTLINSRVAKWRKCNVKPCFFWSVECQQLVNLFNFLQSGNVPEMPAFYDILKLQYTGKNNVCTGNVGVLLTLPAGWVKISSKFTLIELPLCLMSYPQ